MSRVAAIQMASGTNIGANLLESERLIAKAAALGAELVVLPENFSMMGMQEQDKLKVKERPGEGMVQHFLAEQAAKHAVWLVGGTVSIESSQANRVFAATPLYNSHGELVCRYDKIHLFDIHLPETGERYNESEAIEPGERIVVVDTPFGRLGIAVCYDLRFPGLFRRMIDEEVELIALPAAFTAMTGKAHWEVLVRARAIENLSYMIASAQGGYHVNGRETHGDSMIVDPWGVVLDRLPRGSGVVVADVDMERLREIRRNFPVLEHRKLSCSLPSHHYQISPSRS
ncbi:carbon-nitrogen hydrolase family protein [Ectothiorhodospiraceae bacterium BW-2]|nr:carbon-nitrogen hydrolase family protein [Ectothiorhodospiraceae bacterium BW-2]